MVSTDWTSGSNKTTGWTEGTDKSSNWGSQDSRDFSTGYLLLQNGDYLLLQGSGKIGLQ